MPALAVYGPTGSLIDDYYGTTVAYAGFSAPTSGVYTVVVYDWSTGAASTGDYDLYFTKAPGANEGGLLEPGGRTSGSIELGDLDSYTFEANAGEGIALRVADLGGGAFVPALAVYGPTGNLIDDYYGTTVAYAGFSAPTSGVYTLVVYDWSTGAASTGDYDLYYTKAPGANEGGLLEPGSPVSGTIEVGDLDSFTLAAAAGDTIQLSVVDNAGGAFVPAIALYLPTGGLLASTYAATTATIAVAAPASGTFTVVIYDWSTGAAASGDYALDFTLTSGT